MKQYLNVDFMGVRESSLDYIHLYIHTIFIHRVFYLAVVEGLYAAILRKITHLVKNQSMPISISDKKN